MANRLQYIVLWTVVLGVCACQSPFPETLASQSTERLGDVVSQMPTCVWYILHDSKNRYWLGTSNEGVYLLENRTITRYTMLDGLAHNSIGGIQEDSMGNILIETRGGISLWNGQAFRTLESETPFDPMNGWYMNPKDMWFRGQGGPLRYDGDHLYQLTLPYTYVENDPSKQGYPDHLKPNDLYTIYRDNANCVWFGTADVGLCRFDGQRIAWLYEDSLTYTPAGGAFGIRSILQDSSGKFWICNTRQQFEITGIRDTLETNVLTYSKSKGIIANNLPDKLYIMSMLYDQDGKLWMGTYNQGVWSYDGRQLQHVALPSGVTLFAIYTDRTGQILLGTHEAGVMRVEGDQVVSLHP